MAQVLRFLDNLFPVDQHPNLPVGLGAPDDAAVYKLSDQLALIQAEQMALFRSFCAEQNQNVWLIGEVVAGSEIEIMQMRHRDRG